MERYIAIDNVCAWPNLKRLPDGTILAFIFNQPTHSLWEGDVECWASADGGRVWEKRGVPAPHEPRTNRMNIAAGLTHGGEAIVIAAGYSNKGKPGTLLPKKEMIARCTELPWVCRSGDGGTNWAIDKRNAPMLEDAVPKCAPGKCKADPCNKFTPFGDIVAALDGTLVVPGYISDAAYWSRSADDGRTWSVPQLIAEGYHEPTLLQIDGSTWIAALRSKGLAPRTDLFISADNAHTWSFQEMLAMPGQMPAHLLRLSENRVLVTFGTRWGSCAQVEVEPGKPKEIVHSTPQSFYAVFARISCDRGKTWSAPRLLADLEDSTDGGYPSSVVLDDGTIVTAFYANVLRTHRRYHMGVVRWRLEEFWKEELEHGK